MGVCVPIQGFGADRCLCIFSPLRRTDEGEAGSSQRAHQTSRISPRVREVWWWCQEEGGRFWSYSQVFPSLYAFMSIGLPDMRLRMLRLPGSHHISQRPRI